MASKKHDKTQEEQTSIEVLNEQLTSVGQKMAGHSKQIMTWSFVVAGVALLVIGYIFLIHKPGQTKAMDAFNNVEVQAAGNDSIAGISYKKVADQYKGTDGGNLAALSAGEALYDEGKYAEAAKYLERFKTGDRVVMASVEVLLADCYVNMSKYNDALSMYDQAIRTSENNPEITPRVLDKKARVYDKLKKYDEALKCYESIEKQYPSYQNGAYPAAAYAERERARLGK